MARKPKTPTAPAKPLTREDMIMAAIADFYKFKNADPKFIATPNRYFNVGDPVRVGALDECTIADILFGGKAYVIRHMSKPTRDDPGSYERFGTWWWLDVWPMNAFKSPDRLFQEGWRGGAVQSALDSLMHLYTYDGLVCNPEYQRGYVWTDEDRNQLLDSIFDRMDIGKFVLVRNEGYNHEGDHTLVKYKTITGEDVEIERCKNYCVEIIDGQQRLTTIIRFMLDLYEYRGRKYSNLNFRDRCDFDTFSVHYRLLREEEMTRKQILQMFMKVNRGVPQQPEHLEKVRKLLEAM
jgi:hypothetical protein